eukprot:850744-Pleurochrysis_carterae.AAC.1
MHEELLMRTTSCSCKYCTTSLSAVLSTADELIAPLCSRLVKIAPLPSGSNRTSVHASESGAASERGGRAASRISRKMEENSGVSTAHQWAEEAKRLLNEALRNGNNGIVRRPPTFMLLVVHSSHLETTAMNEELVVRARSSSGT